MSELLAWLVRLKHGIDEVIYVQFFFRRKLRILTRRVDSTKKHDCLSLVIMCVKRTVYVRLAIRNINSLHFHNPSHTVTLYVDHVCAKELRVRWGDLDYPEYVRIHEVKTSENIPWQGTKIEALIYASTNNAALVDADTIWQSSPTVEKNNVTFLVEAYPFAQHVIEVKALRSLHVAVKPSLKHYVTGFVYVPKVLMTSDLKTTLRRGVRILLRSKLPGVRRLAEEITVSAAIGISVSPARIRTLKTTDGPHDKHVMTSLYYGCTNNFME